MWFDLGGQFYACSVMLWAIFGTDNLTMTDDKVLSTDYFKATIPQ